MPNENQEQETQDFEIENSNLESEQEAEAESEQEEAEIEGEQESEQGEEDNNSAPKWVKEVRRTNREQAKKIKELESKLNADNSTEKIELPAKPKLADFDYDEDTYETALDNWHGQKQKIENVKQTQQQQIAQQQAEFNTKLQIYNENVAKLNIDKAKFTEAEDVVKSIFDKQQQSIMVLYTNNPAKLVSILGRDEDIAEDLAKITDPIKFAVAIAKYEEKINMKTTKTAPPAERKVNASTNVPVLSSNKKLEQLRAEADKTGNYSKVIAYKKTLKGK